MGIECYAADPGFEEVVDCPTGLYWDDSIKECNFWEPSDDPEINLCENCPWDLECYYDVENDISKFIQCNFGEPVYHSCATGLVWNPVLNVCDWPNNSEVCNMCQEGHECLLPSPDSSTQYFRCPGGIVNCKNDMIYDADKNSCIYSE